MPSGGEVPRPGATESSVFTTPGISPLPYFRNVCPTLPVAYGVGISCKFLGVYIWFAVHTVRRRLSRVRLESR